MIAIKVCIKCYHPCPNAQRVCHFCGWQFYQSKKKGGAA